MSVIQSYVHYQANNDVLKKIYFSLGEKWKKLTNKEKKPFVDTAKKIQREHMKVNIYVR